MDHDLIGYLLGALDAEDAAAVEQALQKNPETRRQLDLLRQGIWPFKSSASEVDVPAGLSARTCRQIRDCGGTEQA